MISEKFGLRIKGTDLLFWGPAHLHHFRASLDGAHRFDSESMAQFSLKRIVSDNTAYNSKFPNSQPHPTEIEIVKLIFSVEPL